MVLSFCKRLTENGCQKAQSLSSIACEFANVCVLLWFCVQTACDDDQDEDDDG